MSRTMHLLGAALVAVVGLGACAPVATGGQNQMFNNRTTLVVENNNWADMTVYLVRDGMKSRIGSVPAIGRAAFILSNALIGGTGEIRLMADPLGSNQLFLTEPIHITPGQQVSFRVENNVQLSSYSVW